jgi:hypothetical protein
MVSLKIRISKIIQQPPPLPYQLQETTTRMMILYMDLEVFGEMVDALA